MHARRYQASQRILHSHDPLPLLATIAGDFPMLAPALTRTVVNASVKEGLRGQPVAEGHASFAVNGVGFDPDTVDLFALEGAMRREAAAVDELTAVGLRPATVAALLA